MRNSARVSVVLAIVVAGLGGSNTERADAEYRQPSPKAVRQAASSRSYEHLLQQTRVAGRPDILVQPTDRSIWDESFSYVDSTPARDDTELLARAACASGAVILASTVSEEPFLSHDREFIFTDYQLTVQQVVRGTGIAAGTTVSYVRPGGKLLIGGRPVMASHNLYPPLETGKQYLLFVDRVAASDALRVAGDNAKLVNALTVANNTVLAFGLQSAGYERLRNGIDLAAAVQAIASASCSR